jgi:hypothetical protein
MILTGKHEKYSDKNLSKCHYSTINLTHLEKLTGSQLVKKFLAFYGTRRFITVFTTARHLSLF